MEQRHRKCKTRVHKVNFNKTLLYGVETWTCTKTEESKMQAVEIKFLNTIMGKTKRNRIRNAHFRKELRLEDIQNQIKKNRLRWFGRVKRMDEHRIYRSVLDMKMSGKRPRSRLQRLWLDKVK
jgi:hypothetical protein